MTITRQPIQTKIWILYFALAIFYSTPGNSAAASSVTSSPHITSASHTHLSSSINPTRGSSNQPDFTQEELKQFRNKGNSAHQTVIELLKEQPTLKPKQLLRALRLAGYTSTQSARAVENQSHINSALLTDLMFDQQYSASQSCRVLRHVYQADAKQALVQLSISGYDNKEILHAIKNIYQLENNALIVQLSEGYAYEVRSNKLVPKNENRLKAASDHKLKSQKAAKSLSTQSKPHQKALQRPHLKSKQKSQQKPQHQDQQQDQQQTKKITSILQQQGVKAELVAYLLQTRYNADLTLCAQMLRYVGYKDSNVFTALLNTYSPKSSDLISGFINAGYRADQVLPFLLKNFAISNDRLRQQLQTAGYPVLVIQRAFDNVNHPLVANRAAKRT